MLIATSFPIECERIRQECRRRAREIAPGTVYQTFPLLQPTTPEDYAKIGPLTPAPDTFDHSSISKMVR